MIWRIEFLNLILEDTLLIMVISLWLFCEYNRVICWNWAPEELILVKTINYELLFDYINFRVQPTAQTWIKKFLLIITFAKRLSTISICKQLPQAR